MKLLINNEKIISLGSSYMNKFLEPAEGLPLTEEQIITQWAEANLLETDTFEIVSDEFIPQPPAPTKSELEDYLAKKRWQVETGGVLFNGMTIPTDDRAKTLIEGAADDLGDAETTKFKVNGAWVTLNGITMRAVRSALRTHVKVCFAMEASLSEDIQTENITAKAEIDNAAWPS